MIGNTSAEISTQTETNKKNRPTIRGKVRGAMANRPMTRGYSKNLFSDHLNNTLENTSRPVSTNLMEVNEQNSPTLNTISHTDQIPGPEPLFVLPNIPSVDEIDYTRINRMIEESVSKMFRNCNLQTRNIEPAQSATRLNTPIPHENPMLSNVSSRPWTIILIENSHL